MTRRNIAEAGSIPTARRRIAQTGSMRNLDDLSGRQMLAPATGRFGRSGPAAGGPNDSFLKLNRMWTAAFSAAGIVVLAGTDALVPGVVPEFSLHDELSALVVAGLTPRQALESATSAPCAWLDQLRNCGVVAPGARADLLLLDADPLANISNTRRISAVIARGRYIARAELDRRLRELKIRHEQLE